MFYKVVKFIASIMFKIFFKIEVKGIENVPKDGKVILCSNHANNLDPMLISIVVPRKINWMAKKELFKNKTISFLIRKLGSFPVDRDGTDITAIKNALRVLKNDEVLGIFPEGTRVSSIDLENAKPGVALLSIKSQATVVPVLIESNYKLFSKAIIHIGKPLDLLAYYNNKLSTEDYSNISKEILNTIYKLNLL